MNTALSNPSVRTGDRFLTSHGEIFFANLLAYIAVHTLCHFGSNLLCLSHFIMLLFLFSDEVPEEPEVEGKFTFKKPTKRKSEGFIADQVKPAKKKKEKKERTGPKQTKSNKMLLSFGDEEDEG